jgi:wyosine [tRNA(Phe)-imidazoG37] synthetase (radical SAM superfamily)
MSKNLLKFIYGPVPSRRLGQSIGIDPLPSKTCNYQCIYCQLGKTTKFTNSRENFFPVEEIIAEMELVIPEKEHKFDYVTFVGSGEPTLYKNLGYLIDRAKEITNNPVCVITNGSLISNQEVQNYLLKCDSVLPTLDAGDEKLFIKINRPHPKIRYSTMVQGLIDFRSIYDGNFWIEVMIMKGINDSKEELLKIKEKMDLIQPDRIDLNIPIRPPTVDWVKKPDQTIFGLVEEILGDHFNITLPEKGKFETYSSEFEKELLNIIERHPMREKQIIETFSTNLCPSSIMQLLKSLETQNKIQKNSYNGEIFWKLV